MSQFSLVATGGTFDLIHRGHLALLSHAFAVSDRVIIGLTSDGLAEKKGKTTANRYERRLENLRLVISKEFPGSSFQISKLEDDFGPAVFQGDVQALIVSDETSHQGNTLNKLRAEKGLDPIQTISVPMILAEDGARISSTRIRNSEVDSEGNLLSVDK